jgi:hypothetical protein
MPFSLLCSPGENADYSNARLRQQIERRNGEDREKALINPSTVRKLLA